MQPQPRLLRKTKMKKSSEVFSNIRFAKLDPKHDKGPKGGSTDDEEHGAVSEIEWNQQLVHQKKRAMQEEIKDKYDEGEYDREGDMAKSDLRSIIDNAKRLHDMIDDADNLPEWVQSKITKAEDYISTVANYMTAEVNEEVEILDEKNAPTNPSLWSRAKALARSKFDVYPSAYANGWASKWYKSKGGGWKTVSEEKDMKSARIIKDLYKKKGVSDHDKYKEEYKKARAAGSSSANARARASGAVYEETLDEGAFKSMATDKEETARLSKVPFDKPYKTVKSVVTDKSGAKHTPMSRARDLARKGTRAASIVREAADKAKAKKKEKKVSDDTFQAEPELSNQIIRND